MSHDADCEFRRRSPDYGPCWCAWRAWRRECKRIVRKLAERDAERIARGDLRPGEYVVEVPVS